MSYCYVVILYNKRNSVVYTTKMATFKSAKMFCQSWVAKGILGSRSYKISKDNGIIINGE